jgi:hypothetical protein
VTEAIGGEAGGSCGLEGFGNIEGGGGAEGGGEASGGTAAAAISGEAWGIGELRDSGEDGGKSLGGTAAKDVGGETGASGKPDGSGTVEGGGEATRAVSLISSDTTPGNGTKGGEDAISISELVAQEKKRRHRANIKSMEYYNNKKTTASIHTP